MPQHLACAAHTPVVAGMVPKGADTWAKVSAAGGRQPSERRREVYKRRRGVQPLGLQHACGVSPQSQWTHLRSGDPETIASGLDWMKLLATRRSSEASHPSA